MQKVAHRFRHPVLLESIRKPSGSYFRVISLDKMRNDVAHVRSTGEKAKVVIA